jgi:hypothetical protein
MAQRARTVRATLYGDWRDFRLPIWLTMIGIAVALLVNPWVISVFFFGGAIGIAARVLQARRRSR